MTYEQLAQTIFQKQSYLCVGLDPDPEKLPESLEGSLPERILAFNKGIIEATEQHCVAYKPNTAFYESLGSDGWEVLHRTFDMIPRTHLAIADAKRGDIGNTSRMYANAFLNKMRADAITVAPYMGADSVQPFLEIPNKWVIVLALTSNSGSQDFQTLKTGEECLYERVLKSVKLWGTPKNTMFVIGATQPKEIENVRRIAPEYFLLVPGVGAQGGSLEAVSKWGLNTNGGLLVNSSRGILYASRGADWQEAAAQEAATLQAGMAECLKKYV
jgi:orotidine-5'-phosphate decarboxylase